jgi:hypothetical protein
MFRELLAHPQEVLQKLNLHLVYCVRVMSAAPGLKLIRIKRLYMFRALLAHPQGALYKRHLIYCVRVMSVGCTRIETNLRNTHAVYQVPSILVNT